MREDVKMTGNGQKLSSFVCAMLLLHGDPMKHKMTLGVIIC